MKDHTLVTRQRIHPWVEALVDSEGSWFAAMHDTDLRPGDLGWCHLCGFILRRRSQACLCGFHPLYRAGATSHRAECGACGAVKPSGQSCPCFDNHCQ